MNNGLARPPCRSTRERSQWDFLVAFLWTEQKLLLLL